MGAGAFGDSILVAENIIHNEMVNVLYPSAGVSAEYGEYLANVSGCRDCHGVNLSGGKSPEPTAINAPNLTPGGELIAWSEDDFFKSIREGVTPSGHPLDPAQMSWEHFKNFSDDELKAIWVYLQSLPKLETTLP